MLMERLIIYWTSLIESRYVNSSFVSMMFDNQSMARSEKTTRVDTVGTVDFPFLNLCFYTILVVDIHIQLILSDVGHSLLELIFL